MIAVYLETWACPWVSKPEEMTIAKIDSKIDVIYLSFVDPKTSYQKGQKSFSGTGLNFSMDFEVVRQAILLAQQKGQKVFLAIGGATYNFEQYQPKSVCDLAVDLNCDGLDIDWEPIDGYKSASKLTPIIQSTRGYWNKLLSLAGFSTGCFEPNGDTYRGMNIEAIKTVGYLLNWINIMAYDAGKGFDVKACYESYQKYYSGTLLIGLQVGTQGWGDAYLTMDEVYKTCSLLKPGDGCFVWAYFKQGTPNCQQVVDKAYSLKKDKPQKPDPTPEPKPEPTCSCCCKCPYCGHVLLIK